MLRAVKIAFASDTHLGYAATRRVHPQSGLNVRVIDGYKAFRETIDQVIAAQPDVFVHGGDVFHVPHPDILSIRFAQDQMARLAEAGIPAYLNVGNHDVAGIRGRGAAPLVLHDPARRIHVITNPTEVIDVADGLVLHALSHAGLAIAERPHLAPIPGAINLFTAHGAASIPGSPVFHCSHSPNEQPIGLDLITDDWDFILLGHYHGRGALPGYPRAWYAGSAIARGFSDPPGGRGWMLLDVAAGGAAEIITFDVAQRPILDLPVINGSGLTGEELTERVRVALAGCECTGAIIRQVITNVTPTANRGIDHSGLARLTEPAMSWRLDLRRPDPAAESHPVATSEEQGPAGPSPDAPTRGDTDLATRYAQFVAESGADLTADALRDTVVSNGQRHLRAATGEHDVPDATGQPTDGDRQVA